MPCHGRLCVRARENWNDLKMNNKSNPNALVHFGRYYFVFVRLFHNNVCYLQIILQTFVYARATRPSWSEAVMMNPCASILLLPQLAIARHFADIYGCRASASTAYNGIHGNIQIMRLKNAISSEFLWHYRFRYMSYIAKYLVDGFSICAIVVIVAVADVVVLCAVKRLRSMKLILDKQWKAVHSPSAR